MIARAARTKFAEPIGRRYSAIHKKVAAGDKRAVRTHEECADSGTPTAYSGKFHGGTIGFAGNVFPAGEPDGERRRDKAGDR